MTGSAAADKTILVVEDDDDCREMLRTIIEMQFPDAIVHTASNGRSGLEQFLAHSPFLVITDLNMPELNGAQMAEQMARLRPQICIIFVTADTELAGSGLLAAEGRGTHRYLAKPVNYDELFVAIERCLLEAEGVTN